MIEVINPHYPKPGNGRQPMPLERMPRIYFIQHRGIITWEKNPYYWKKPKPYLDNLRILIIPDQVMAKALVMAGEADVWLLPFWEDPSTINLFSSTKFDTMVGGYSLAVFKNKNIEYSIVDDKGEYLRPEDIK